MDKKKRKKGKKRNKEEGGENEHNRERKIKGKRDFRFSLRSMEIGPSVFIEARSKVDPRNESYAWVPKSGSFDKL